MEYVRLGRAGLRVSRLCLGTMNFGPLTSEQDSFAIEKVTPFGRLRSRTRKVGVVFWGPPRCPVGGSLRGWLT